ncbi:MAG: hypothetical protein HY289_02400 [Planctomycetes bacterium]|nr:hypothetical protein [Planctomycetota bacterium]
MKRTLPVLLLCLAFTATASAQPDDKKQDAKDKLDKKSATVNWQKLLADMRKHFAGSKNAVLEQTRIDRAAFELDPDDPDQPPFLRFEGVCLKTAHDDDARVTQMKETLRKELESFLPNLKPRPRVKIDNVEFLPTPVYALQKAAVKEFKDDPSFNVFFNRATYAADGKLQFDVVWLRSDESIQAKVKKIVANATLNAKLIRIPGKEETQAPEPMRRNFDWLGERATLQKKFADAGASPLAQARIDDANLDYSDDSKTVRFNVSGVCMQTVHDDEEKSKDLLRQELAKVNDRLGKVLTNERAPKVDPDLQIGAIRFLRTPIYALQASAVKAFKADATFNNFFERATYGPDGGLRLHVLCLRNDKSTDTKLAKLAADAKLNPDLMLVPGASKTQSPKIVRRDYDWLGARAALQQKFADAGTSALTQARIDDAYLDYSDDFKTVRFNVSGVFIQTVHDEEAKSKDLLRAELINVSLPNVKADLKIEAVKLLPTPIYKLQENAVQAFKVDATFNNFFERATYGPDGGLRLHVLCLRYDLSTDTKLAKLAADAKLNPDLMLIPGTSKTQTPKIVRRDYDWLGKRIALQKTFAGGTDLFFARTRLNDGYLHYVNMNKSVQFDVSGVCIHPPGLIAPAERDKLWKSNVSNLFPDVKYEPVTIGIAMMPNPSIAWQNDLTTDEKNDGIFFQLGQFDPAGNLTWIVKLPDDAHQAAAKKVVAEKPIPAPLQPTAAKAPEFQTWKWADVLPRGQARLAEGDFLLHRARLDRVFLKYDDLNLGDPYLHIDGVSLHPIEVVPANKQRTTLEAKLANLLPVVMVHKWNSSQMRFLVSPIYALQTEVVGRNIEGMLFADGLYDKFGMLHLSVAVASEGQRETVLDIVKTTPMLPGVIGPRDDKTAPRIDFNPLPWDDIFEQMQIALSRDNDTLLRKTRVDRGVFSFPASKIGPDLTFATVGIYPKNDVYLARLKKRFDGFVELYLTDRLQAGPVAALPIVQHVEDPAPILQPKVADDAALDGVRLDDASFHRDGSLVFHGMWVSKDQQRRLEDLIRDTLTGDHPALRRGIHWGSMQDFDSPALLHEMRTWVSGQETIDEVWLERFYFDAAGQVRIAGFATRVPDRDKSIAKLKDYLPKFANQKLPAIQPPIVPKEPDKKEPEKKDEKISCGTPFQWCECSTTPLEWHATNAQPEAKVDDRFKLDLLPNIKQYLRDNIPKVVKCDGLRVDRCYYDPQGVFRIEGLADHANHTQELKTFLDDELAPFDRKRQLARSWKEGRQTVIPLRPMMIALDEQLPSLSEFDGVTFRRAHHDPQNRLVLTGSAIGEASIKDMTPILKRLLETHEFWRLRTTEGLVIDISDRKKADRELAKKNVYRALHLLQVNIGEASVVELPDTEAGWWSHAWPFEPRMPRLRPTNDDYDRVIQYCDAALLHDPANVLAWYLRGYVLQTKGRSDLSLRDYRRMAAIEIDDPEVRHKRILALELVQGSLRQSAFRIEQEAILQVSESWTLRELRERPAARNATK